MEIQEGQNYKKTFSISSDQVKRFAELTGDQNPIHLDEHYAKACGFPKPIVHGFLSASIFSRIFGMEFPGEGTVYLSQTMSFKAPIFPDEPLAAEMIVLEGTPKGKYRVQTNIRSTDGGEEKITGEALILYRPGKD
ncbi:MAG: MaoC family dehydratase [Candidatus Krumholzibacteria bacterium]|nr:MaoC family dehydratase [Candidatus Krumholzibacteria bacterium]